MKRSDQGDNSCYQIVVPTKLALEKGVIMNISRRSAIKSAASAAALLVLGGCGGSGAPEAADDGTYTLVTDGRLTAVSDMYFRLDLFNILFGSLAAVAAILCR